MNPAAFVGLPPSSPPSIGVGGRQPSWLMRNLVNTAAGEKFWWGGP
jgi:hypothetical protein